MNFFDQNNKDLIKKQLTARIQYLFSNVFNFLTALYLLKLTIYKRFLFSFSFN